MKNILVVDDEEILRNSLKLKLEENGFMVLTATNGQEAIRISKQANIDFILLDLLMPGIHGTDVVSEIQKNSKQIPIIILTNIETGSYQDGVVEYLIKSETSLDKIVSRIKFYLGLSE
jgi:DNA-binding response OmpR family regulator